MERLREICDLGGFCMEKYYLVGVNKGSDSRRSGQLHFSSFAGMDANDKGSLDKTGNTCFIIIHLLIILGQNVQLELDLALLL